MAEGVASGTQAHISGILHLRFSNLQAYLLRSSSLEYFVPCRVACKANPFLVIWYTQTPGDTEVAPEYAPPVLPVLAAASACPAASQPELTNRARALSVSNKKIIRESFMPAPKPAPMEIIFMKVS